MVELLDRLADAHGGAGVERESTRPRNSDRYVAFRTYATVESSQDPIERSVLGKLNIPLSFRPLPLSDESARGFLFWSSRIFVEMVIEIGRQTDFTAVGALGDRHVEEWRPFWRSTAHVSMRSVRADGAACWMSVCLAARALKMLRHAWRRCFYRRISIEWFAQQVSMFRRLHPTDTVRRNEPPILHQSDKFS
ncbi:hypothetical protein [Burkholderia ubonensis]|uniref:hypothetical protein n=1 Tax=Burkholderia ubonensis TaxID=101571 RepID=UPI0012F9F503|nr:hypothetical protein [Burkholderia ubonensis]